MARKKNHGEPESLDRWLSKTEIQRAKSRLAARRREAEGPGGASSGGWGAPIHRREGERQAHDERQGEGWLTANPGRWRNGDADIRRLERIAKEDGTPEALIAYGAAKARTGLGVEDPDVAVAVILQNYQSGAISQDQIHMGAAVANGQTGRYYPAVVATRVLGMGLGDLVEYRAHRGRVEALNRLGQLSAVRLAADYAERVLPIYEATVGDDIPHQAIAAARAWADAVQARTTPFVDVGPVRRAADAAESTARGGIRIDASNVARAAAHAARAVVVSRYKTGSDVSATAGYAIHSVADNFVLTTAGDPNNAYSVEDLADIDGVGEMFRWQLDRYLCYLLKLDPSCAP